MCATAGKRRKKIGEPEITVSQVFQQALAALGAAALSTAASLLKRKTGSGLVKWRLHTHFEVDRSVPIRIDVTRRAGLWTGRKPTLRSALQVLGDSLLLHLRGRQLRRSSTEKMQREGDFCRRRPMRVSGTGKNRAEQD